MFLCKGLSDLVEYRFVCRVKVTEARSEGSKLKFSFVSSKDRVGCILSDSSHYIVNSEFTKIDQQGGVGQWGPCRGKTNFFEDRLTSQRWTPE